MSGRPRPDAGLTAKEAAERLQRFGPNRLVAEARGARLKELLGTFADPMALMLAAAAVVYLFLGETRDGLVLLAALVPVLAIDVVLEVRSRDALKKLAAAVAPRATVVRDGAELDVATEDVVPGDLLVLREGDVAHADGVVKESNHLATDESSLTGESEPQEKEPGASFFAGSLVLSGFGLGEVTATGPKTQFGKIALLVGEESGEASPLQRKMRRMVKGLALGAGLAAIGIFGLALLRGRTFSQALLQALSLGMSAAPEEFLLVVTVFLSLGAYRLSTRRVLVRRLASVEALGSTTVICTDKTGTLTTGRFTLQDHVPLSPGVSEDDLVTAAVLACEIQPADTLEQDIVAHGVEHGIDVAKLREEWRLVFDYPFDAKGKHMSHVWERAGTGARRIVAKGALEGILEHCAITPGDLEAAEAAHARLAHEGIRVLAVAGRDGSFSGDRSGDEEGLSLYGLIGFRDSLREEVPAAIAECQGAGIAVKLVTGDHPLTAHAIATAAGIFHDDERILTGEALEKIPPAGRREAVSLSSIFARIRPEQKHGIVDALAEDGEVVAMTGDGINDAPALRRAAIGIAMGRRGTEVARAAADLVLLDDDFTAIVFTIREGRHIFDNIRRAFLYLLPVKVTVLGLAFVGPLVGLPILLLPVHLVWLELIVHPVAALVFEGEPAPSDLMKRPPRDPKAPLLSRPLVFRSVLSGLLLSAAALGTYAARLGAGEDRARSAALAVMMLGNLAFIWAAHAVGRERGWLAWPRTVRFWVVFTLSALSLPLFLGVPGIARLLRAGPLPVTGWAWAVALALLSVGWRAFSRIGDRAADVEAPVSRTHHLPP